MPAKVLAAFIAAALPAAASAAWQMVAVEQGKRVEIDRESTLLRPSATMNAKGDRARQSIMDPKTSAAYRIIEIESRYDCAECTYATLKVIY